MAISTLVLPENSILILDYTQVFLLDSEMEVYESLDVFSIFNSFDIGLALGIWYKFPVSEKTKLFFELDMQGGFENVLTENSTISGKNSRSVLNFGILFTT